MKEKAITILLILVISAPAPIVLSFMQYQKKQIRREVKSLILKGVDKSELVLLKFSRETHESLRWEKDHEFEYKDEMYDVVEKEVRSDSIFYWCWWDKEETDLNKKRNDYTAQILGKDQQRNQKQEQLFQFFKQLYFAKTLVVNYPENLKDNNIPYQKAIYNSPYPFIFYPPPIV